MKDHTENEVQQAEPGKKGDDMIFAASPLIFLLSCFLVFSAEPFGEWVMNAEAVEPEFMEISQQLLNMSSMGWLAIAISGLMMVMGGSRRSSSTLLLAGALIAMFGGIAIASLAAAPTGIIISLALFYFLIWPVSIKLFDIMIQRKGRTETLGG